MPVILGIDPGQTGALVWLDLERRVCSWRMMPAAPGVGVHLRDLWDLVRLFRPDYAVCERAQSMPGDRGAASMAKYHRDYGSILMALVAAEIPHETVHPSTWLEDLEGDRKQGDTKDRAARVLSERLPWVHSVLPVTKKERLGVVDAACIAYWGELHGLGRS